MNTRDTREKVTSFQFLEAVLGGIALCKKHEVQYIKEKTEPSLNIWESVKSGNMPCKFCLKR
jgi:hypothetical protein